jgi:hypothetical protein
LGKLLVGVIGCAIASFAEGGVLTGCAVARAAAGAGAGRILAGVEAATIGRLNAAGVTATAVCCTDWALAKACCGTTVTCCWLTKVVLLWTTVMLLTVMLLTTSCET